MSELRRIADTMERKRRDLNQTADPQQKAVLEGELADLSRALTSVTHGKRITKRVQAMIADDRGSMSTSEESRSTSREDQP